MLFDISMAIVRRPVNNCRRNETGLQDIKKKCRRTGAEEEEEQIVNVRTLVCGNGQSKAYPSYSSFSSVQLGMQSEYYLAIKFIVE